MHNLCLYCIASLVPETAPPASSNEAHDIFLRLSALFFLNYQ